MAGGGGKLDIALNLLNLKIGAKLGRSFYFKLSQMLLDKERQRISGEFGFESYDENNDRRYRITGGKFGGVAYAVED